MDYLITGKQKKILENYLLNDDKPLEESKNKIINEFNKAKKELIKEGYSKEEINSISLKEITDIINKKTKIYEIYKSYTSKLLTEGTYNKKQLNELSFNSIYNRVKNKFSGSDDEHKIQDEINFDLQRKIEQLEKENAELKQKLGIYTGREDKSKATRNNTKAKKSIESLKMYYDKFKTRIHGEIDDDLINYISTSEKLLAQGNVELAQLNATEGKKILKNYLTDSGLGFAMKQSGLKEQDIEEGLVGGSGGAGQSGGAGTKTVGKFMDRIGSMFGNVGDMVHKRLDFLVSQGVLDNQESKRCFDMLYPDIKNKTITKDNLNQEIENCISNYIKRDVPIMESKNKKKLKK